MTIFKIDFQNPAQMSDDFKNITNEAFNKWDNVITGVKQNITGQSNFLIEINISIIDTADSWLAEAGPDSIYDISPPDLLEFGVNLYTKTGIINVNKGSLQDLTTSLTYPSGKTRLYYLMLHEIGHVLGIGFYWIKETFDINNIPVSTYLDNNITKSYYTGTAGLREYKNLFKNQQLVFNTQDFVGIPIEDDGGSGTANGHLEEGSLFDNTSRNNRYIENIFHPSLDQELMTGWAEKDVDDQLSRITIGLIEDLGYEVNYAEADDFLYPIRPFIEDKTITVYKNTELNEIVIDGKCFVLNKELNYAIYLNSAISDGNVGDLLQDANTVYNQGEIAIGPNNKIFYNPPEIVDGGSSFKFQCLSYYYYIEDKEPQDEDQILINSAKATITINIIDPSVSNIPINEISVTNNTTTAYKFNNIQDDNPDLNFNEGEVYKLILGVSIMKDHPISVKDKDGNLAGIAYNEGFITNTMSTSLSPYTYVCGNHAQMKGKISVLEPSDDLFTIDANITEDDTNPFFKSDTKGNYNDKLGVVLISYPSNIIRPAGVDYTWVINITSLSTLDESIMRILQYKDEDNNYNSLEYNEFAVLKVGINTVNFSSLDDDRYLKFALELPSNQRVTFSNMTVGPVQVEPDTDNDGVVDNADAFPNDPTETADADDDSVGDNADAFPNDPTETADADDDGVGDNADAFPNDPTETADADDDGVGDNADAFPNDPNETADTDGDGVGDNADSITQLSPGLTIAIVAGSVALVSTVAIVLYNKKNKNKKIKTKV